MSDRDLDDVARALEEASISRSDFLARAAKLGISVTAASGLLGSLGTRAALGSGSAESATISYYKGAFAPNEDSLEATIIKGFNKTHPQIKVKFEQYDWTALDAQATASFASHSHDIVYLPTQEYAKFPTMSGPVQDMTKYVADPSWKATRKSIRSSYWNELKPKRGVLGAVPYALVPVSFLFVNLDLMKKAGVGPGWNKSYASMRAAAKKMTNGSTFGLAYRTNGLVNFGHFDWIGYFHRAGVDFLNPSWTGPGLNRPAAVQTFQFLADLANKDKVTPPFGQYTWAELRDLFQAGRIGILHDETTLITILEGKDPGFKWDVALHPKGPVNQNTLMIQGVLTVDKQSKQKQPSWEFIKYLTSPAGFKSYFETTGILTVREDVAPRMFAKSPKLKKVQTTFLPHGQGLQMHPHLTQFQTLVQAQMDELFSGKTTAAKALKEADAQIRKNL